MKVSAHRALHTFGQPATENPRVGGSIPPLATITPIRNLYFPIPEPAD